MAMRVYHGTSIGGAYFFLNPPAAHPVFGASKRPWIYVTETAALAARYANAQARGEVRGDFEPLAPGAAILVFESDEPVQFQRRPADHNTLDLVESVERVDSLRLVRIVYRPVPDDGAPRKHKFLRDHRNYSVIDAQRELAQHPLAHAV